MFFLARDTNDTVSHPYLTLANNKNEMIHCITLCHTVSITGKPMFVKY